MSETSAVTKDQPARSPFAGCLIIIIIAVVVIFVIAFGAYSFKKQTEGFASFSEEASSEAPIASTEGATALTQKLSELEKAVSQKTNIENPLTAKELNLAIAHFEELKSLRGVLSFTEISETQLQGQLHLPLASTKDLPEIFCKALGIEQRDNFLKATFAGTPLLTDGKLFLTLETLTPSRGEIPTQVIQAISPFQIFTEAQAESSLQKTINQLSSIEVKNGTLVATYSTEVAPPSGKEEADELAQKARHLIALGAVIFILTMILVFIFLAKRKKAAQG